MVQIDSQNSHQRRKNTQKSDFLIFRTLYLENQQRIVRENYGQDYLGSGLRLGEFAEKVQVLTLNTPLVRA